MTKVIETTLPGVGIRHDFMTKAGDRIGVIFHRTGRRDLLVYDQEDPDICQVAIRLEEDDVTVLTEIMGASEVTKSLTKLQQSIQGLTIDWIPVKEAWACAGKSIQEIAVRTKTGVSIVAVVRDEETIASPGPDFRLFPGDVAVVVGTPDGIRRTFDLLEG